MRLDPECSFECYEEAGFLYDATLGYNDRAGYRAGISFPFRPYDPGRGKAVDLVELPLGVQDVAVECEGTSEKGILKLAERVRECGGMLSLLWHQSAFHRSPLYEAILRWAKECGAWVATGREIASWWRARGQVEVRACWTPPHLRVRLSGAPRGLVLSVSLPGGKDEFLPALPGRYEVKGGTVDIEEMKYV
ncbi:MAG: hypothetical protein DRP95_05515 [Candidatus Latescibacterota bacterium]|nr:MAG: hypothetical protein DRP95_05515 [Candidatus Latescibacterota bacterium]